MSKIILASSSIYRQELLKRLPIKFTSSSPNINEERIGKFIYLIIKKVNKAEKPKSIIKAY